MSTSNTVRTLYRRVASVVMNAYRISPININATGGSTTTVVSTTANFGKTSTQSYNGLFATVTEDAGGAGAAPEGESHPVTSFNGTTQLTCGTYTAAVANGDKVTLTNLAGDQMIDCINTVISSLPLPRYLPLSLVADGDMETSGDGNWANVGAGTGTKVTTASRVLLTQSLRVQGTSDGDGQRSDAFNVHEGETLSISVPVMCDTGQAQVELYDAGAAAVISGTAYEANDEGYTEIRFQYTVGTGVEQIQVQVTQDGATALDCYVGWVSALSHRNRLYELPSTITDTALITNLSVMREGSAVDQESKLLWRDFYPLNPERVWRDYLAANSNRIELTVYDAPVFIEFLAANTTVSTMAGVFYASAPLLEAIVEGVAAECFQRLGNEKEWAIHSRIYAGKINALGIGTGRARFEAQRRVGAPGR